METAKRLEAARRALARAEESVGLSSAPSGAGAPAGEWSVPDALSWLFPRGLSRGMTVGVRGSRLAALLVAGIASGAGAWSVFLGCAGTGWAVAASLGVDLDRTVCVPRVGEAARFGVVSLSEGNRVTDWHEVPLTASQGRELSDAVALDWTGEVNVAVIASAGSGRSVFVVAVDGSEVIDLGPVSVSPVQVTALPRPGGDAVALRAADGTVLLYEQHGAWQQAKTAMAWISYPG